MGSKTRKERPVKTVALIARILLGLVFAGLGSLPFFIQNPPPQPGLAGEFTTVYYQSHWVQFVAFAQVVAGLLLLANRYVPLALIIVAAFLYNSYAFHITMLPIAIAAPIVATILGLLVALQYRDVFAPIFRAKPTDPSKA
jgi:putative oxidoreductase